MASEQEFAHKMLTDEAFRAQLKSDPKGTLAAHGMTVPDDVEVEVVESTAGKRYVVLPPVQGEELSDEMLNAVQGGTYRIARTVNCYDPN